MNLTSIFQLLSKTRLYQKKRVFIFQLTTLFLMSTCSQVFAKGAPQKVTLSEKNAPLEKVLAKIELQTGNTFLYEDEVLQKATLVTVYVVNASLEQVLNLCFKDQPLTFKVFENTVVVKVKENLKKNFEKIMTSVINLPPPVNVRGRIVNENGEPMAGVSVTIKGTSNGTSTDNDGRYTINAPDNSTLIFTSVGFETREIAVNRRSNIDLSLVGVQKSQGEVVVIGYGTQRRSDLTGAISTVGSKEITGQAVSNVNQALQGKIAGVEFTSTSGEPGGPVQVRVRGMGTFGDTGPLYVVDGVPVSGGDINSINPNDIASISVLKDASASAIYGSRAANGVILITTKKGVAGKTQLSYNGYYGTQTFNNFIPMLNSVQLADLVNDAHKNGGYAPQPAYNDANNLKTNTDWQRAAIRSAPMQDHALTISGGSENARFLASFGHLNQEGILVFSGLKRFSVRVNSQFNVGNKLTISQNINITRQQGLNLGQANNLDFAYLLGASPTMPIYRASNLGGYAGPTPAETGVNNRDNLIARRFFRQNNTRRNAILGSLSAEYKILPSLKYRLNIGINNGLFTNKLYVPIFQLDNRSNNTQSLSQSSNESNEYLIENTLSFEKVIHDNYALSLLAGYTQQNAKYSSLSGSRQDFPSNDLQVFNAGTGPFTLNGTESEWALRSFLGRANITFFNKYLFTTTIRRDGSSRFGKENQYGNFPSFAIGWNINRENFMKDSRSINDLKLRASWGRLGNQEIGNYSNQTIVSTAPRYFFGANVIAPAAAVVTLGNPALKWETTTQTNVGIDLTLFKNLTFSADYWVKNTEGILLRTPISAATGINRTNGAFQNAASLNNSGFEFILGYRKSVKDFTYALSANLSTVANKVTSLGGGRSTIINQVENVYFFGTFTKTDVGAPMSSYYGYVAEGVFQNQGEIDKHAKQPGAAPGDIKFKDLDGNNVINANDRTIIGDPFPNFTYGFSANGTYKAFDVSLSFYGVQGKQLYNAQRAYLESMWGEFGQMATTLNRWKGEGTSNTMPRAVRGDPNLNSRPSTRYVDKADFLRLQNVQIGYTIPEKTLSKVGIKRVRAFVSAQNLLTITSYPNYSPDGLGGSGYGNNDLNPLSIGVDTGNYPIPTILQAGAQVNF